MALRALQREWNYSSQNWLISQACPRFIPNKPEPYTYTQITEDSPWSYQGQGFRVQGSGFIVRVTVLRDLGWPGK